MQEIDTDSILLQITPLILTYNETPNIARTLKKLSWAKNIVVIDSYSTDATLEILKSYSQIEIILRKFDTHTNQWNYGLDRVTTEWVLSLDADYVLSNELIREIKSISRQTSVDSYFIPFRYCVFGKPLRGTILPPRQSLFRKSKATYIDDGHTQLLKVDGKSVYLKNHIFHDDRKSLDRWLWAQNRYAIIEAKKLTESPGSELNWSD